jgi:hypothetical protein
MRYMDICETKFAKSSQQCDFLLKITSKNIVKYSLWRLLFKIQATFKWSNYGHLAVKLSVRSGLESISRQTAGRRKTLYRTRRTVLVSAAISAWSLTTWHSAVLGRTAQTCSFTYPHKRIFTGVRSWNHIGRAIDSRRPFNIQLLLAVIMRHNFYLTARGTSSSNPGTTFSRW